MGENRNLIHKYNIEREIQKLNFILNKLQHFI